MVVTQPAMAKTNGPQLRHTRQMVSSAANTQLVNLHNIYIQFHNYHLPS